MCKLKHFLFSMGRWKRQLALDNWHTVLPDRCFLALIVWHPDPKPLVLSADPSWLPSALH